MKHRLGHKLKELRWTFSVLLLWEPMCSPGNLEPAGSHIRDDLLGFFELLNPFLSIKPFIGNASMIGTCPVAHPKCLAEC